MRTSRYDSRFVATLIATLLVLADSSHAAEEYDPYKVPRERVAESVRTIAMAPIRAPVDCPEPTIAADFERMLAAQLEAKGYEIVASPEYETIWRRTAQQVGGVFDPLTGESDPAKFDMVRDLTVRELARRYQTDAVLSALITIEPVASYAWISYSAVGEVITWQGRALYDAPLFKPQLVLAPALGIILRDLGGTELYNIQIPIKWWKVFVAGGYEERPASIVYRDDRRNAQVVSLLLAQLIAPGQAPLPAPDEARSPPGRGLIPP